MLIFPQMSLENKKENHVKSPNYLTTYTAEY